MIVFSTPFPKAAIIISATKIDGKLSLISTILIIIDSYFPPKKAAEIPKKDPIIRAKIPYKTPTPKLTRKP